MTTDPFDLETTQPMDLDPLSRAPAGRPTPTSVTRPAAQVAAPTAAQRAAATPAPVGTHGPASAMDLRRLRLRAGLAVQVVQLAQVDVRGDAPAGAPGGGLPAPHELQFLAAISGKGVMVGPASEAASASAAPPALTLKAGQEVVVRGFTGQHDFSFSARVLQTFIDPFVYALLSYPAEVQARQVRQAPRLRTALPARLQPAEGPAADATVVDLSPHGALLHSAQPPGRVDDVLTVTLHAVVRDRRMDVVLPAKVRHTQAAAGDGHHTGVQFIGVQDAEWLVLQALCAVTDPA